VTFFEEAKSSFAIHFQQSTKIQLSGFVTGRLVSIVSEARAAGGCSPRRREDGMPNEWQE
jgi:hypothetical protein